MVTVGDTYTSSVGTRGSTDQRRSRRAVREPACVRPGEEPYYTVTSPVSVGSGVMRDASSVIRLRREGGSFHDA